MKKLSALLLALVLTAAPLPKAAAHTQELLVRYSAEQGFTVTIPEAVTLYSGTEEATGYGTFGVNSGSLLSAGQKLAIAITASQNYYAGKFRLKCSGESVYMDCLQ